LKRPSPPTLFFCERGVGASKTEKGRLGERQSFGGGGQHGKEELICKEKKKSKGETGIRPVPQEKRLKRVRKRGD